MNELLLPYQKAWIKHNHKYSLYVKSRRIGITFAEACWSVRRRILLKEDHFFVTTNEKTSAEFIRYCKAWAKAFGIVLQSPILSEDTTTSITMPNGSRIVALSSNPTALRGLGGSVSLDEMAFHENQEELLKAASPVVQWGGQLRIISTQNGHGTVFDNLLNSGKYPIFKTTIYDAVADGLALKVPGDHLKATNINEAFIQGIKDSCYSIEAFNQEYNCEVSTSNTIISQEEYQKCILNNYKVEESLKGDYNSLYCGIDIGRSKNLTVIWVIEAGIDPKAPEHLQTVYRTVAVIALKNMPFQLQYERIAQIVSHPSIAKVVIDRGAIGAQLAEDLAAEYGGVEPLSINHTNKAILVEKTKKFIAQERISLPDNTEILNDFLLMKRTSTKTGLISYDGNSGVGGESHCDYFIACALALFATENTILRAVFKSVGYYKCPL